MTNDELKQKATHIRELILTALAEAGSGHTGGSLDLVDVFTVLYFNHLRHEPNNPKWDGRDKVILSIGHTAPVLYATLAASGYFPEEEMMTLRKLGSRLQGHPSYEFQLPGLESCSGSLGQGLGVALGMALAAKMDGKPNRVFCIMGDGEQQEGSEDIPVVKPIVDGHQYVNLGLPSGRLWATCNVGAENDYDYGDYYAWGEILPYYADGHNRDNPCNDWREMTTCAGNTDISSGYAWHTYSKGGTSNTLTEWSPEPYDNDYVLKPDYDVATQTWGEGWCMPTVADFEELRANTDRTWYSSGNTEFNGVAGMKCVSKTDPTKFIFLPGASYRKDLKFWGTSGISTSGYYWANSCKVYDGTKNADQLTFTSGNTFAVSDSGSSRFRGCTVRPVVKKVTE